MFKLKILLTGLFILAVLGLGWWFGSENTELVRPTLFGIPLRAWSLGTWLSLMLLIGSVLGYLISLLSYARIKGQNLNLQRKLQRREQEVAKLRTASIRG